MTIRISPDAAVFYNVYKSLHFPLFAGELRRLIWGLRAFPHGPSHLRVPLTLAEPDRRAELSAAIGGFFSGIEPDQDSVSALFEDIARIDPYLTVAFAEMVLQRKTVLVAERGDQITWEEASLWPLACSGIFQQLANILSLHIRLIQKRIKDLPGVTVLSEYPRHLPTELHYAMGSLGAWIGGAANVQFFGLYLTQAPLGDPAFNQQQAQHMGYTPSEATAIADSGLVALPDAAVAPLLAAQKSDGPMIIGSIAVDESNMANPPSLVGAGPRRNGFLVDTHYRAAFNARELGRLGRYGAQDVRRDHYADFYESLPAQNGLVRCKHYCAPIVDVDSREAVERIVAAVPLHGEGGLFFRGQSRLRLLDRHASVRHFLFADSCGDEPSFPTAASRPPTFDYDSLHFALRRFLGDRLDSSDFPAIGGPQPPNSPWQDACEDATCTLDYALMALAQHYGIPTHGLDVTTDVDVALWFALNKFERASDGRASYRRLAPSDWHADSGRWPVVLVCQQVTHSIGASLHACDELEAFGLVAARPRAQAARFFLGGHSDHRNRLAETLVCLLRLAPRDYGLRATFDSLFPSPEQDLAYRLMLDFANRLPYQKLGAKAVNRFHG